MTRAPATRRSIRVMGCYPQPPRRGSAAERFDLTPVYATHQGPKERKPYENLPMPRLPGRPFY